MKANQLSTYTKTEVDDALDAKANQSTTYMKTEVNVALTAKQRSFLSTTFLLLNSITTSGTVTANQIISRFYSPPTGYTDIELRASQVYFGYLAIFISATSAAIKLWSPVYVDQGLKVQNGLSIGLISPSDPEVWVEKIAKNQNGNITTTGTLSASNIYTKDEVNNAVNQK